MTHRFSRLRGACLVVACLTAVGCQKPAGPPVTGIVTIFQGFEGQHFSGNLYFTDANHRQVAVGGTLELTLVAGEDLCTATVLLKKSEFQESPSSHEYPSLKFKTSTAAPCPRPPAGGPPMNLRWRLKSSDGAALEETVNAAGAYEWAQALQAKDDEAALLARIPHETQRLMGLVDLVPAPSSNAPRMVCPDDVAAALREGPVARIAFEHLQQIAGRARVDPNFEIEGYWMSGVGFQRLAQQQAKKDFISAKSLAEALKQEPYLKVVRIAEFIAPKTVGQGETERRKGVTIYHTTFSAGSISAVLSVVDVEAKKIVCGGPVSARNSTKVSGVPLDQDLMNHFNDHAEELEKAIAGEVLVKRNR